MGKRHSALKLIKEKLPHYILCVVLTLNGVFPYDFNAECTADCTLTARGARYGLNGFTCACALMMDATPWKHVSAPVCHLGETPLSVFQEAAEAVYKA